MEAVKQRRRFVADFIAEARQRRGPAPIWEILIFLLLYIYMSAIASFLTLCAQTVETVFFPAGGHSALPAADQASLTMLFSFGIPLVLTLVFCRYLQKRSLRSMGFVRCNVFTEYIKGLVFGAVLFSAVIGICVAMGYVTIRRSQSFSPVVIALFFAAYFVQGMAEEVMIRGNLMTSLTRRTSAGMAIILSSLVFSLLHAFNHAYELIPSINLFLWGVIAALYMIATGNIWGACAMHTAWNFVQGNVFGFQVSGHPVNSSIFTTQMDPSAALHTGGAFGPEGGYVTLAVEIAAVIVLLIVCVRTVHKRQMEEYFKD